MRRRSILILVLCLVVAGAVSLVDLARPSSGGGPAIAGASLTRLNAASGDVALLTGSHNIQATAAAAPEFVSGPWRIAAIAAARAGELAALELPAQAGLEWLVVVADVTNWSSDDDVLDLSDFAIRVDGEAAPGGFVLELTASVAALLGTEPATVTAELTIPVGETRRVSLVFQIAEGGGNPALFRRNIALPLTDLLAAGFDPQALPPPTAPPPLQVIAVEEVLDGATLRATLPDAAAAQPIRLAGVNAPVGDDCFAERAAAELGELLVATVWLEGGTAAGDELVGFVWAERPDGSRVLVNRQLLANGYAGLTDLGPDTRFATWMAEAERTARARLIGLWGECPGLDVSASPEATPETPAAATPSEATPLPSGSPEAGTPDGGAPQCAANCAASLTMEEAGAVVDYEVWIPWAAHLVTTPDGGAWAFFSGQSKTTEGIGTKRLYASHFDPATGLWSAATAMPGGKVQFGVTAVVDPSGVVHVVFSDRVRDTADSLSTLVYTRSDSSGGWTAPTPVAPHPDAGHQLSPSLVIDRYGGLHLVWQDQRSVSPEARAQSAADADIFASSLGADGAWTAPVQINLRPGPTWNASRPHLVVDGDRLVAVWSVYEGGVGLDTAVSVDWSVRPPGGGPWSTPRPLIQRGVSLIGGRLIDLVADPRGGVIFAYVRTTTIGNTLSLMRLPAGSDSWGDDMLLGVGDRGNFPAVAITADGTAYVAYNLGHGTEVVVGAVVIPPGASAPGEEVSLTSTDEGAQGLPIITIDASGKPWILYFNEPPDGVANEVRIIRLAEIAA